MKKLPLVLLMCVFWMPFAHSETISIDWAANGGANEFNRQAINFAPIDVDGFVGFQSDGYWRTGVNSTGGSGYELFIYLDIGGVWQRFASMSVVAPAFAEIPLNSFNFFALDFSQGALQGINFTEQTAGAGMYQGMVNNGNGTQLLFSTAAPIPEPGPMEMMLVGLGLMGWVARRSNKSVVVPAL